MAIYSFEIERIIRQIPREGIDEAVIVLLNDDDTITLKTTAGDDLTAELLWDALNIAEPREVTFEPE